MPRTPDRFPGEREEEGILFDTTTATLPVIEGEFKYVQGVGFKYFEGGVEKRLLSVEDHQTLRQMIHFIDGGPANGFASGAYREIVYSTTPWPDSITWYVDASKTEKIIEKVLTRNGSQQATTVLWRLYASDGSTVIATVTDTVTYIGAVESSRLRSIS